MTSETRHDPTRWDGVSRPITPTTRAGQEAQSVHYNSARHGNHVEDSPELLRLRADSLLDEMMMGGVDVSAADSYRTFSGVDAPVVNRAQPSNPQTHTDSPISPATGSYSGGGYANGHDGYIEADRSRSVENGHRAEEHSTNHGYGDQGYRNGHHDNGHNGNGHYGGGNNGSSHYASEQYPTESRPIDEPPRERPYQDYNQPMRNERAPRTTDLPSDSRLNDSEVTRPAHPELESGRYYDESRHQPTRPMPPAEPYTPSPSHAELDYADYEGGRGASRPYGSGVDESAVEPPQSAPQQNSPKPHFTPQPTQPGRYKNDPFETPRKSEPKREESAPNPRAALNSTLAAGEQVGSGDVSRSIRENRPPAEPVRREPSNVQTAPVRPPLPPVEPQRTNIPPRRAAPQPLDQHTQWASEPEKWEYQDFSANPDEEPEVEDDSLFTHLPPSNPEPRRIAPDNSAVRHDPAQFVSAMSVMGGNKKRSTLLPRSSELDIDLLNREISELHGQISMLLPVGNETGERARHLLDKAYSILQSDPSRSAEVEYYMQQVRTIVQRLHQARQWSDLYRQRLNVYLWSWVGLSAMVLFGRFFFQIDLEDGVIWLLNLSLNHWLVMHWAAFIGTAAAGALGGAIGALYTMRNHARSEYSFFDRKYGLRGLILPLIGLIVGAVGYWVFGLLFALVGINPSQTLVAAVIPMTAAFAFGFSQESIYGTRG